MLTLKHQVILREFRPQDTDALADIIRITWGYDKFGSHETACKLARAYLDLCLTNQTCTQVAIVDGVPVGIIMGKNIREHKCPEQLSIRQKQSMEDLCATQEGRDAAEFYKTISEIDDALLKQCEKTYQGEVAFFVVNAEYRGLGIGGKLFDAVLSYMKQEEIHDFYLFTDTSCNYSFYEYKGMKRQQVIKHQFTVQGKSFEFDFFLYDYHW